MEHIMILYIFEDFVRREVDFSYWISLIDKDGKDNAIYIVNETTYNKSETKLKNRCIYYNKQIEESVYQMIQKNAKCIYDEIDFLFSFYDMHMKSMINIIDNVCVLSSVPSTTLENVCKRNNKKLFYFELAPFRSGSGCYTDYVILQEKPIIYCDKAYVELLYSNFLNSKDRFVLGRMLTKFELLALFCSRDNLYSLVHTYLLANENYEYGIAASPEYVANSPIWSGEWTNKRIAETVKAEAKNVLFRSHPSFDPWSLDTDVTMDQSASSIEFILQCKKIVVGPSKLSLEALLCDKCVIGVAGELFWSRAITNLSMNKCVDTSLDFLNFVIFYLLVPCELFSNNEYQNMRANSNMNAIEVCNYNAKYIFEKILGVDLSELKNNSLFAVLGKTVGDMERCIKMDIIENFQRVNWMNKYVHICGTGKDSRRIKYIVEKAGAIIKDYLISNMTKELSDIDNIPIKELEMIEDGKDEIYVVTQANLNSQIEVIESLKKRNIPIGRIYII